MANKVTMTIAGEEYTFVADENAAYMEKVCGIVDKRMTQLTDAKVSRSDAAVLAAVNLTDELLKSRRRTCAARSSPISTRSPISSASSSRRRTSRATSKTASDGEGIDGTSLARRLARGA